LAHVIDRLNQPADRPLAHCPSFVHPREMGVLFANPRPLSSSWNIRLASRGAACDRRSGWREQLNSAQTQYRIRDELEDTFVARKSRFVMW